MIDIGFIGLGTMGRPMAGHLQAAGHRLFLHDVGPVAPELVAAGGVLCKSGKQVAEEADVVIIMVPDTPHVEAVLFGAGAGYGFTFIRGSCGAMVGALFAGKCAGRQREYQARFQLGGAAGGTLIAALLGTWLEHRRRRTVQETPSEGEPS